MEAKRGSDSIILAQQSSGRVWVGESRDGKKQADSLLSGEEGDGEMLRWDLRPQQQTSNIPEILCEDSSRLEVIKYLVTIYCKYLK